MNLEQVEQAMKDEAKVELRYAAVDGVHTYGRIIGYYDAPTVVIETPDGTQVTWLASLAHVTPKRSKRIKP